MEVETCDKAADEKESDAQTETPHDKDLTGQMDESGASVGDQAAGQHHRNGDTSSPSETTPELILVLVGDTTAVETGSENILIDPNEQTWDQFSPKLYDLCGRTVSVINLLGFKALPLKQEAQAFVLLLTHGPHAERYAAGLRWLEQTFGRESLAHVLTVVTHESDENCEGALTDLRSSSSFNENRYHTCSRNMTDGNEILRLLDKVDAMVSENQPQCCSTKMLDGHEEQEQPEPEDNYLESPVTQQKERDELMKCEDKEERKSEKTSAGDGIFSRLQLEDKRQQKMSPADFLKISSSVKRDHETSDKDLPCMFLQRLMMLEYRARYIPVKQRPEERNLMDDDDDDDDDDFYSSSNDTDKFKQTPIHPMDVQMAVFHCSDSFLKQNLVTKLSQCQYALPLLVPDPVTRDVEFPLWTFRQITKTWKTRTKDDAATKSLPVSKAQTPLVTFFRLGSLSVSKSQLMNAVINERHSTFFHRNCAGSTKSRLLMDGVAEIAWFCPAGKPNDAFTDCVAFCNLHGDALEFEQQRQILVDKSSVNVVLVPTLGKGDRSWTVITELRKSEKPLIFLIGDDNCDAVGKKGKYKMGLKDRSLADVSVELKEILAKIFSGPHGSFQLEAMADVCGIRVDEYDPACLSGESAAMEIVELLKGKDVSQTKEEFLPCQGELWHNWCRKNKELYHLRGNIEKEKCKKQQELVQIREDQMTRYTESNSQLMKLFIKSLVSLPTTDREFFLKWTQILIDDLSNDGLCSILRDYNKIWSEVLVLKKKQNKNYKKKEFEIKQTELEQISKKLQSATFGLEHIFREMGQIYEAHKALNKRPEEVLTDWSKYPELAAELLISGHPMELMDGDAGHVPLTWIRSVLDQVVRKLGDKRVFVLSVLGVQSSGKSTMLNAMFGLQFAVSAGRCTKGAFMQLVEVSEEMTELRFDYVLVVDTEGLRALELEGTNTLHHDNELATFVVGLGNMTLINIYGENPSDMQDVLQIVVQAFMRMKEVKLSPSCVFVHQNVSDITAAEKNMDGKRRLQEKLDQMVQLAAKEEGSDAECFSDIIAFDVQRDVKYFAQLWEGSPPMAPPNPGYSESIQDLKDTIICKAAQSAGLPLSQFSGKVQDLWEALRNESFVFSFKNTLEISVYRKLEVEYGNWTWTLRSNMLTIENQLHTRIENGKLDKVDLSYITSEIHKTYEDVKKDMTTYFEHEKDRDILVQWRGQFEIKIKEFHEEHAQEVKRKLDEVLQQKMACKKLDDQKTDFENKLLQKSKELAQSLNNKDKDEEELKKQFNSMWSSWVSELTAGIKPIEDINLKEDELKILQEIGFEEKLLQDRKRDGKFVNFGDLNDYVEYVKFTVPNLMGKKTERQLFTSFIEKVEKESMNTIQSKPVATRGYTSMYLQEVAKSVKDKVCSTFESQKKFTLKKIFTVDLLLFVFGRAEVWLLQSYDKFKTKNNALTYLENKKPQYFAIFKRYCNGASSAVVLGELICDKLKVSTTEAVCNKTAIELAREMRCNYPAFNGNRLNLEKHVLTSLAEKEDFFGLLTYITDPKSQVKYFIQEEVKKYMFEQHKDKALRILNANVNDINNLVTRALVTATKKVKTQSGDINTWLEELLTLIRDHLAFDTISSENFSDIKNFDFLREQIEEQFKCIIKEMTNLSLHKMKDFRQQPDQILIEQLCSCCWETCPFCGAVCTNTMEDHRRSHSTPYHRSAALNGMSIKKTENMSIGFCTTNVASDKCFHTDPASDAMLRFKDYRKAGSKFDKWRITPEVSKLETYWKWVVCRFQQDLENYYELKFEGDGQIPREWKAYSKEDAIKSLDEMCL